MTEQLPPAPEARWSRAIVVGAARRLGKLLAVAAAVTALASVAIGLPSGNSLLRSLSTGFYLAGCCTLVVGFALAARGPLRPRGGDVRGFRWATPGERDDAIDDSALFIVLAVVLLVLGVATDTRYPLL